MVVSLSATLAGTLGFAHTLSLYANQICKKSHEYNYWEVELWQLKLKI